MPIVTGRSEKRRQQLQRELERITPLLAQPGVKRVILIGSLATERVGPGSDIDLVVVQETETPFLYRRDFFYKVWQPRVHMDIFVYTPQEYEEMLNTSSFLRSALRKGRSLYEARPGK